MQGACLWGTICNASAGMGRAVTEGYGECRGRSSCGRIRASGSGKIYKDVPVAVGMRAGSHFNVPYRLEKYLPLEHIKTVNTGVFDARLKACWTAKWRRRACCRRSAKAEQLGLRKIREDRFKTLWWTPANALREVDHRLYTALVRAEQAH